MKMCSKCGSEKDLSNFYYCKREYGSPYSSYCKDCHKAYSATSGKQRTESGDIRYRATKMISAARSRDSSCELTQEWVVAKLELGVCEATGLPFEIAANGGRVARPFTPSLDRKDSSKGYTEDNTQVVCWIYNRAKGVDGHEAVVTLAKALANG